MAGAPAQSSGWSSSRQTGPTRQFDGPSSLADTGRTGRSVADTHTPPFEPQTGRAGRQADRPTAAVGAGYTAGIGRPTEPAGPTSPNERPGLNPRSADGHSRTGRPGGRAGDTGTRQLHRFTLYESDRSFFLVGADVRDQEFRLLTINRDSSAEQLAIRHDQTVYSKAGLASHLSQLEAADPACGGIRLRCSAWGLVGFIRFTGPYYMVLVTKRTQVALIGGHLIFQVDGTELVPVVGQSDTHRLHKDRTAPESRYLSILANLNLNRNFYFSYGYNLTQSLQNNITFLRTAGPGGPDLNSMFVWNHYLREPVLSQVSDRPVDWCLPLVHGFVGQSSLDVFGRRVFVTVIARRSRFYAGARFLKRGVNDSGYVANDVETEQIVSEMVTTSLHSPSGQPYGNPAYSAYVQHRGSIPLFWSQDNSGVSPKPGIELNVVDPFYHAAGLHFDNLFDRYGRPVFVLNLVKARERVPRESILLHEYETAVRYLNQSLPEDSKIIYRAFDMSRASKSAGQDVVDTLERIAEEVLDRTDFFRNTDGSVPGRIQNGIARTNCIDCLDRTNAAQFVIAKCALGRQLQALGIIPYAKLEYEMDAVNIFSHIFHDHGNTIATQYGGSFLVNTMATYRKINQWQSSSRDMVESFKRYYNNSFTDSERQKAYNLFLGNYVSIPGQPALWDLPSDHYLHQISSFGWDGTRHRHYIHWYTPRFLSDRPTPPLAAPNSPDQTRPRSQSQEQSQAEPEPEPAMRMPTQSREAGSECDFWDEYYRPHQLTVFAKLYAYRISSSNRYSRAVLQPGHTGHRSRSGHFRRSPFQVHQKREPRATTTVDPSRPERQTIRAKTSREFVSSLWPLSARRRDTGKSTRISDRPDVGSDNGSTRSLESDQRPGTAVHSRLLPVSDPSGPIVGSSISPLAIEPVLVDSLTITDFYERAIRADVSATDAAEYAQYVQYPTTVRAVMEEPPVLDETEIGALLAQSEVLSYSSPSAAANLADYIIYLRAVAVQTTPPIGSTVKQDRTDQLFDHNVEIRTGETTETPADPKRYQKPVAFNPLVLDRILTASPVPIQVGTPRQRQQHIHQSIPSPHTPVFGHSSTVMAEGSPTVTHSRTNHPDTRSGCQPAYMNENMPARMRPAGVEEETGDQVGVYSGESVLVDNKPSLDTVQFYSDFVAMESTPEGVAEWIG